jgi:hypothetical protein
MDGGGLASHPLKLLQKRLTSPTARQPSRHEIDEPPTSQHQRLSRRPDKLHRYLVSTSSTRPWCSDVRTCHRGAIAFPSPNTAASLHAAVLLERNRPGTSVRSHGRVTTQLSADWAVVRMMQPCQRRQQRPPAHREMSRRAEDHLLQEVCCGLCDRIRRT